MDVDYLKKNVGETLATGLAAVVMNNPPDSVDFLAKWLLNYVDNTKAQDAEKAALAAQVKKDEEEAMAALAEYEAKLKLKQDAKSAEHRQHTQLDEFLMNARDTEGLLERFIELLQGSTEAGAVYVGDFKNDKIKYIAATKGQEFMLTKTLQKSTGEEDEEEKTPVTFTLFDPDEEKEDEDIDDDESEERKKPPPGPQVKSVMVPNVLMGPLANQLTFFRLQQMGCYYTVKINYEATLNNDTLEMAAIKEDEMEEEARKSQKEEEEEEEEADMDSEETEEKERDTRTPEEKAAQEAAAAEAKAIAQEETLISALKLEEVTYALCIDTLGQNRRLTPKQVAFINKFSLKLMATLERIDRAFFKDERKRRRELKKFNGSWGDRRMDQEEESEELMNKLAKRGSPQTPEDVRFLSRQQMLSSNSILKRTFLEHSKFEVLKGPLSVCRAFLYLLGWKKADLPNWRKVRACFNEDLLTKVRAYNPRDLEMKREPEASTEALQGMLDDVNLDDLKDTNQLLAEMWGYVNEALALTAQAEQEARDEAEAKRLAEEEAERERLEEEERLKAEAEEEEARRKEEEEASAASASAEGEGDDTES